MKRKKAKGFAPKDVKTQIDEISEKINMTMKRAISNPKGAMILYPKYKHTQYVTKMIELSGTGKLDGFSYEFGKLDDNGTIVGLKLNYSGE